jgi:hypothetical protein
MVRYPRCFENHPFRVVGARERVEVGCRRFTYAAGLFETNIDDGSVVDVQTQHSASSTYSYFLTQIFVDSKMLQAPIDGRGRDVFLLPR